MRQTTLTILTLILLVSCGPKPVQEEATAVNVYPVDVNAITNDGAMQVSWKKQGDGMIGGYNIYISEEPLVTSYPSSNLPDKIKAHNYPAYPGDTDPQDGIEHYDATGLENGVKYYVHVRVVNPDQSLSKPSNEVVAVCGPRGSIELGVRNKVENDGYSFDKNAYTQAASTDNDIYFFSQQGEDVLASPSRLNGFINVTKLTVLPFKGSLEEVSEQLQGGTIHPDKERVEVTSGDWILIETASERFGLLNVKALSGSGEDRKVTLDFVYSTIQGEMYF